MSLAQVIRLETAAERERMKLARGRQNAWAEYATSCREGPAEAYAEREVLAWRRLRRTLRALDAAEHELDRSGR